MTEKRKWKLVECEYLEDSYRELYVHKRTGILREITEPWATPAVWYWHPQDKSNGAPYVAFADALQQAVDLGLVPEEIELEELGKGPTGD